MTRHPSVQALHALIRQETGFRVVTHHSSQQGTGWDLKPRKTLFVDNVGTSPVLQFESLLHEYLHWIMARPIQHTQPNLNLEFDRWAYYQEWCCLQAEDDIFTHAGKPLALSGPDHREDATYKSLLHARKAWRKGYRRRMPRDTFDTLVNLLRQIP